VFVEAVDLVDLVFKHVAVSQGVIDPDVAVLRLLDRPNVTGRVDGRNCYAAHV